MSKPIIKIYDCSTGETIEREMTAEEITQHKADQAEALKFAAYNEAKAAAKLAAQAKLSALGLTVEDLLALGL